ncbi:MAG: hypothetical protein H6997_09075 [Moraxellaceae bacterium]|nr:hypothetical protein [Moraxellaceae bacterium]
MDFNTAKIILSNLRERIDTISDGRYRLEGVITQKELNALDFLLSDALHEQPSSILVSPTKPLQQSKEPAKAPEVLEPAEPVIEPEPVVEVELDLSVLDLPECGSTYRVCLDFGTAMSKATFVNDNEDADLEQIHVLQLGIPGDQENIDYNMLISSLFIDNEGRIWFGYNAIEQSQAELEGGSQRLDNIKRWLSEGNLSASVEKNHNPTSLDISYEHIVLAYLAFFTWTVNEALAVDVSELDVPRNFMRRFAMPCFPRANASEVERKLKRLLGEAQVLADTFKDEIHKGLLLTRFLSAVNQLRASNRSYSFIDRSITEPLGVAGSSLSWRSAINSLSLVVDIGAGTSDFSLYRLHVVVDEYGDVDTSKTVAMEVDKSARGITEAGNHLDQILKAFILNRAGITASHPKFINIAYHLERDIRNHKETLFNTGAVFIVLYNDETVEISLEEFLSHDAVKAFETSLRNTMVDILESVDPSFIDWVQINPTRRLVVVLTGGGAALPMAQQLAKGTLLVNGSNVAVAAAKAFPTWLEQDYPDLEQDYPRIAVSLGGARKNLIQAKGVATTTGSGIGGHKLESIPISGN